LVEVAQRLGTDLEKGLTTEAGEAKLKEWGKNSLTEKKKTPWYCKLIHEFTTVFSLLLWGGMVFAFIAYGIYPDDPSNVISNILIFFSFT
jgi:sodium/potassium-transporting ATPase subunit alpha